MKSLHKAIDRADKMSKGNYPETTFVVYSKNEDHVIGNDYHVCFEFDLDTFYAGAEVLYCSEEHDF